MIRRLEKDIAAEIDGLTIGPERDRRVPVVAVLVTLHRVADRTDAIRIGRNGALGPRARIGDADDAALQVGIDPPWLVQVGNREEPVAAAHDETVVFPNPFR